MYFDTKKFRVSLRNHRKRLRSRAGPPAFFFFSRYGRACVIISFIERIPLFLSAASKDADI